MTLGTVKAPTPDELRKVAADLGMSFSDDDLAQHLAALLPSIAAFNIIVRKQPDGTMGVSRATIPDMPSELKSVIAEMK